jgi:phosphoglycolate phosphatase-like HAD superfamily hydrolase
MAELGRTLSRDEFAATFGLRNDAILPRYLGTAVSAADVQRIGDGKEAHYRDLVHARGVTALPGVREWLARLRAAGWRQAIASSGPRLNSETILASLGLEHALDAIIGAEDVVHGKPHRRYSSPLRAARRRSGALCSRGGRAYRHRSRPARRHAYDRHPDHAP